MTDLSAAKALTDDEDYVDLDRTGYTVTPQGVGEGGQVTYSLVHDATGRGLGAYATLQAVDGRITADRAFLAATPTEQVPVVSAEPEPEPVVEPEPVAADE